MQRAIQTIRAGVLTLWLLAPTIAAAQLPPMAGRLLVSQPSMDDALFAKTVVLLVHHDDQGTIGIFLNRPTNLSAVETFGDTPPLDAYNGPVYFGGPVAASRPLMLVRNADVGAEVHVFEDIYLTGQLDLLDSMPPDERTTSYTRIYAGHAEWMPGQLDREIRLGAWRVVRGSADAVFMSSPDELWRRAQLFDAEQTVKLQPKIGLGIGAQPAAWTGRGSLSRFALR